jgi:hypothetical protein
VNVCWEEPQKHETLLPFSLRTIPKFILVSWEELPIPTLIMDKMLCEHINLVTPFHLNGSGASLHSETLYAILFIYFK